MVFMGILVGALVLWLAPRKGHSRALVLVAVLPCIGSLVVLYLLSLTDKQVLDDIRELRDKLKNPDEGD